LETKKINLGALIISLVISLGTGFLSSLLTKGNTAVYQDIIKPGFSPPPQVFPVVWTILYILMGISAYIIYMSDSPQKTSALVIYAIQLAVNFMWSIIFFNMKNYLGAFLWIILLIIWIAAMIVSFYRIDKRAAFLQLPYLLWTIFAAVLSFSIYMIN
jgi:tryptophan-rich sensory protein